LHPYVWTTATLCFTASPTAWYDDYRRFKTLRHVSLPVRGGRDHISPYRQLHWLPVHQRIKFKLAVLVYKSLYGLAPQYLVEECELVAAADRRQLRSSDIATFVVARTYTRLGDRAFPVAGARLWNSLPSNLRQSDLTLQQFRRALKTYLFG